MLEKRALKAKKEQLQRKGTALWIEPAKEVINALELAGLQQSEQSPDAISGLLQKIGTNHGISRKKVNLVWAQPYEGIARILGGARREFADNPLPHGDRSKTCPVHHLSPSSSWCSGQDSNLHALRHTHLKRVCLPIPPPERSNDENGDLGKSAKPCKAPKCACIALFPTGHCQLAWT